MTPRALFRVFWSVALLSNMAAAAMSVALLWHLGDERLPVTVQVAHQASLVVGSLIGTAAGARLVRAIGYRRTLLWSAALQAVSAATIGVVAVTPSGALDRQRAFLVVGIAMCLGAAAGIGGPAWVATVAHWPGAGDPARQLLRDSTQFQLGRSIGPLLGAVALTSTAQSIPWTATANALTYVAVILVVARIPEVRAPAVPARSNEGGFRVMLLSGPVWATAAIAVAVDGGRVFLPRVLRATGGSELTYAVTVSVLALGGVVAAVWWSRRSWSHEALVALGLAMLTGGLASWALGAVWQAAWIVGAALVGGGAALAPNALSARLMGRVVEPADAVATLTVVRTCAKALSAAVLAAPVVALGAAVYLPLAGALAVVALAASARPSQRGLRRTTMSGVLP